MPGTFWKQHFWRGPGKSNDRPSRFRGKRPLSPASNPFCGTAGSRNRASGGSDQGPLSRVGQVAPPAFFDCVPARASLAHRQHCLRRIARARSFRSRTTPHHDRRSGAGEPPNHADSATDDQLSFTTRETRIAPYFPCRSNYVRARCVHRRIDLQSLRQALRVVIHDLHKAFPGRLRS